MKRILRSLPFGFLFLLGATTAFAHGEDRLGPHRGYVRMPSNYHTEVLSEGRRRLKVYLLDMTWKNPSIKDSAVQIVHRNAGPRPQDTPANCEIKGSYYLCTFPRGLDLRKPGTLLVNSQREGQKGIEVSYPLPLRLEKSAAPPEKAPTGTEHGGHH